MREEILESIARTLFVCAMADAIENPESELYGSPQGASHGQDWFDTVTDETPASADVAAEKIVADFETVNGWTVETAAIAWLALAKPYAVRTHNADSFGHYLAMEYLGHGVGLWDDTPIGVSAETVDGFKTGYMAFSEWDL